MRLPVSIDVLEQVLAWQILHSAHEPGQLRVTDRRFTKLAALGPEPQFHLAGGDTGMAPLQGGGAEALVRLCITLVADSDRPKIEQPHDTGDYPLARERAARQILGHAPPRFRQQAAERGAVIELLPFPVGAV